MKKCFKGLAVLAVGTTALVLAPDARATVQITLTNGANSVTITDGGAGDACSAVNCVTFSGALGNYLINVSTGIAQQSANPFLDLNSVNLTTQANAGLLTISTSADGYTNSTPQFKLQVGGTSSLGGASTFTAYGGNSNTLFDTSNQIGTLSFPGSPFANSTVGGGNTVNPYALTIVATLDGITAGSASFNAALDTVPEPASVTLLGAVLLLAGTAMRRKLNRTA